MIAIVDYGMGNLPSVSQALHRMDHPYTITSDPEDLRQAERIILPGVGAFADGMAELHQRGLDGVIQEEARSGKPILGICLGMQLLFTSSEEHGYYQGLNLLSGHVKRLSDSLPVPHIGWNWLHFTHPHPLFAGLEEEYVYFVHSYHVEASNAEDVIVTTEYGQDVAAIVARGKLFGMQFHPEKSGELGFGLLNQFAKV